MAARRSVLVRLRPRARRSDRYQAVEEGHEVRRPLAWLAHARGRNWLATTALIAEPEATRAWRSSGGGSPPGPTRSGPVGAHAGGQPALDDCGGCGGEGVQVLVRQRGMPGLASTSVASSSARRSTAACNSARQVRK